MRDQVMNPALPKKGPSEPFQYQNLRAVAARFMSFCQDYSPFFFTQTRNVSSVAKGYLSGLLKKNPRKNMERMEEYVADYDYEASQNFLSNSPRDHNALIKQIGHDTNQIIGGPDSVLAVDESGQTKKGKASAGVARQYNGRLGKIDNCRVGVYAALCDGQRSSLIDAQLFLPQEWVDDPERCEGARIPKQHQVFRTKPEIALDMVRSAQQNNIHFGWVSFDGFYGNVPSFSRSLEDEGYTFVGAIHKDQQVYEQDPQVYLPRRKKSIGRKFTRKKARIESVRVDHFVLNFDSRAWTKVLIREGTKGFLYVKALRKRVWLWDGEESAPRQWWLLVIRDSLTGEVKYFISNAKEKITLRELTKKAACRYYIERSFQDAKTSVGMGDYQVRTWLGWHHHMAMVLLALLFMLRERVLHEKDVELLSCQDIVELLNFYFPTPQKTEIDILNQLTKRHKKRKKAIEHFYKKQAEKERRKLKGNLPK